VTVDVTGTPRAIALGMLDNDSFLDLVAVDYDGGYVSVFAGMAGATLGMERRFLVRGQGSRPRSVAIADMDNDGDADLVVGNSATDSLSVLLGTGGGLFGAATHTGSDAVGNFPLDVQAVDLDGDAFRDVVFLNGYDQDDPAPNQQPRVRTLFGLGDGTLEKRSNFGPYLIDPDPRGLALADLNGSGGIDAVTAHPSRNSANVLQGKGDGKFIAGSPHRTGDSPNSVALGDVDNDRRNDIVTTNEEHSVSVVRNHGSLVFGSPLVYRAGASPIGGILADVSGDGRPDAVFANRDSGDISVLIAAP